MSRVRRRKPRGIARSARSLPVEWIGFLTPTRLEWRSSMPQLGALQALLTVLGPSVLTGLCILSVLLLTGVLIEGPHG